MTTEKAAPDKTVEGEVVEEIAVRDNSTLVALQRAEIDQQVTTARAYPRNVTEFKRDMLAMATLDQETAESMYYQVPRDGKLITGESVRLAEIAGSCWGNVRYGARVIETGDQFLTARGYCYDSQRNVGIELDVQRRIVNKYGKRYSPDMIQTTGMAACAIALRNAIFKVVPKAYVKPVLDAAKAVAAGDEKTLVARRDAALAWFKGKGVKPEQVFRLLGVAGKDDVGLDQIAALTGVRTALKDGEATLADFFPADESQSKGPVSVASLNGSKVSSKDNAQGHAAKETPSAAEADPGAGSPATDAGVAEAAAAMFEKGGSDGA